MLSPKILICDYPAILERNTSPEIEFLLEKIPNANVVVLPYTDHQSFLEQMKDTVGLITAFIPITKNIIDNSPMLQVISVNATGYNSIDISYANEKNITVCAIEEYCTNEVSQHTIALILALDRNLKEYTRKIEVNKKWQCYAVSRKPMGLFGRNVGIFGFGKIGKAVSNLLQAFGANVYVCSNHISSKQALQYNVTVADKEFIFENCEIITNHMNLSSENEYFFNLNAFKSMAKRPLFINIGRGKHVVEKDLETALNQGYISGAGLDVLEIEQANIKNNPLIGRDNVIITPHTAFYGEQSINRLQKMSCDNLSNFLLGKNENIFKIVSKPNI